MQISFQNFETDLNITKQLLTADEEKELQNCNGDLMEEVDKIMTRLEDALATFKDPTLVKKASVVTSSSSNLATDQDPSIICTLVAEISDLIHAQAIKQ